MRAHFIGEQRRVNAAEDNEGSASSRGLSDPITAQRIPGVDPNADHVTRLNRVIIDSLQRFIDQDRRSVMRPRCRGGPRPGRDDGGPKRHVAWIDEVNTHG